MRSELSKNRGLGNPSLIISDAHAGLVAAIREGFPGASWQRVKVHFMRNILIHVPHREKDKFAGMLNEIWLEPTFETARQRAKELAMEYEEKLPKAIHVLDEGLEDARLFWHFPNWMPEKSV